MSDKKLTAKQGRFVEEYFRENKFNAAQAAIAAGCPKRNAKAYGWKLLHHPAISAAVEQEMASRGANWDRALNELVKIAFNAGVVDYEPWLTGKKTLADLAKAGIDVSLVKTAVIQSGKSRRREVVLHDKLSALRSLIQVLAAVRVRQDGELRDSKALTVNILNDHPVNNNVALPDTFDELNRRLSVMFAGPPRLPVGTRPSDGNPA